MPIKMIVTDLDGTLLRNDKTISAYTASVFQSCYDKGLKIVVATARPIRAVVHTDFYNQLPVDGAVCESNENDGVAKWLEEMVL